ncbi:Hypothetical predicted protein [Pelobates cultripes]|uniref:Uncharacterized protein n=1 Tax=Pelobates cultripes TaxID=61616 RepID=A0AAD1VYN1_PELCU|nr:Hypothetical predicted protein [Pelobates cultripes]
MRSTLRKLEQFREDLLLMAGDLNVSLEPQLDTSTGSSSLPHHSLRGNKEALQGSGLMDSWRVLHPAERDYSYFSTVHKSGNKDDGVIRPRTHIDLHKAPPIPT